MLQLFCLFGFTVLSFASSHDSMSIASYMALHWVFHMAVHLLYFMVVHLLYHMTVHWLYHMTVHLLFSCGCAFAWSHGWIGFLTWLCICFCMALHLLSHGSAFALSHGCAADLFNGSAVAIHTWLCSCFITWLCICFISWLHICFVTRLCIGSFCAFAFSHGSAFASLQSHETLQSVNVQMKRESKRIFWNKPS